MRAEAIFEALGELDEGLVREGRRAPSWTLRSRRVLLRSAVVALLALLLATAAVAFGKGNVYRYRSARGDEITVAAGGRRDMAASGEETCFVRDGRIYIVLDGVEKDITKKCSEKKYYAWEHTYEDGTRLLIAVGGTPERMGYFYVYFFPEWSSHTGERICDFPSFYDYAAAPWVAQAKEDFGLDFLPTAEPADYGDLAVPTVAELIDHGYPVNGRGETYGPAGFEEWLGEPDLELAQGKNGEAGYLRRSELDEATGAGRVHSPEEALAWNEYVRERGPVEIPVYREDGETVVDWFVIGG